MNAKIFSYAELFIIQKYCGKKFKFFYILFK